MSIRDVKALTNILPFEVFVLLGKRGGTWGEGVVLFISKIILAFFFTVPDVYIKYPNIYDWEKLS